MEPAAAGTFIFTAGSLIWIASWTTVNNTIVYLTPRNRQLATGWLYAWLALVAVATFITSAAVWAQQ